MNYHIFHGVRSSTAFKEQSSHHFKYLHKLKVLKNFDVSLTSSTGEVMNYASINFKREHPPLGNPRGCVPTFSPGSRDLYYLNCQGVVRGTDLLTIIKVPSCQLMPHEGTFQLQTDLPSIAAL